MAEGDGIYQLVADKPCDTIYITTSPVLTEEKEKPEPSVTLFLVGDE